MKGELRHQLPYTNSWDHRYWHRVKWLLQKGMKLGEISSNLQCQLYKRNYFHIDNYHRTLLTTARRNSEADCNLKIRTTLIIHERKKKSLKNRLNKWSFHTTAYLSLPSLLLTVTQNTDWHSGKAAIRNVSSEALFPSSAESHRSCKNFQVCKICYVYSAC